MAVLEIFVGVAGPVELVDDEVEVAVLFLRHVLHEQTPRHFAAFDKVLVHAEHVAAPLRLVGAKTAGGVQDARGDEPTGAGLEAVRAGQVENAVVTFVPIREALAHLRLRGARLEAHEGVREVITHIVVLRREVITLRLAFLPDQLGLFGVLVHVMRDGAHVVEEFRVNRPLAVFFPDAFANDVRPALGHRLAQSEPVAAVHHVAQPLIRHSALVGGLGGGAEPTLINAAAIQAVSIGIIRMQLEPQARLQE